MNCIAQLSIGNRKLYLSSLYPIQWDEFISVAEIYNGFDELRTKLNSRHYQLTKNLDELGASVFDIEFIGILNGKTVKQEKYIGGI